jgi:Flp pilus assembly protein TadD
MTFKRPSARAVLVGAVLVAALLYGLDGWPSQALPDQAYGSSAGAQAVTAPSQAVPQTQPGSNSAATAANGTLAAILAAELLLSPSSFYVDLPLVTR